MLRVSARSGIAATVLVLLSPFIYGQQTRPAAVDRNVGQEKIERYIARSWDVLSRSMSDCGSLVDLKVKTRPVLYLPANGDVPASVKRMERSCRVRVKRLPRVIHGLGELLPAEVPVAGLLYLPNRYVVPGGRFNEMYGWDSYFIVLGLVRDRRLDLARGMVENFFYEIDHYGAVLNANRTYYLTRSQPPFLTSMIREVYEHPAQGRQPDRAWLEHAYAEATKEYQLWVSAPHLAGDTGLARYRGFGEGPVPEMADDSSYYSDVIRWLLAHPGEHPEYLVAGAQAPTPAEAKVLRQTSCDVLVSLVCARAVVDGHRLSASFYRGDRAMRESGFDTTFRFGPFSGSTTDFAPVGLNALLFRYEQDMAHFAGLLGRSQEQADWSRRAAERRAAMDRYLWDVKAGMYFDYNFVSDTRSTYHFASTFYPLWAGAASPSQAAAVRGHLGVFERAGGLATSDVDSGVQWDAPYGWAPLNWLAAAGLERYGFREDAARLAKEFDGTVLRNFLLQGTIREKYNVVTGSDDVRVATGYRTNVVGFGWTNAVYLKLEDLAAAVE